MYRRDEYAGTSPDSQCLKQSYRDYAEYDINDMNESGFLSSNIIEELD